MEGFPHVKWYVLCSRQVFQQLTGQSVLKKKKKKKKALGNRKVQNEHGYILFFFIVALGSASLTFSFVTLDLTTLIVVVSSFSTPSK